MKNCFLPLRASVVALVLGAASMGLTPLAAQAKPSSKMSKGSYRISVAQAERIARNHVGRGAIVVRNEGVHGGMYRIHIHRNRIVRHVFVGARTGRVIKTRILSRNTDLRELREYGSI